MVHFYGLKLPWKMGNIRCVFIECENHEVVDEVNNPHSELWLTYLVVLIKNLENKAWESCVIKHVWKDGNAAATAIALANSKVDGDGGIIDLDDAPKSLETILTIDMGLIDMFMFFLGLIIN